MPQTPLTPSPPGRSDSPEDAAEPATTSSAGTDGATEADDYFDSTEAQTHQALVGVLMCGVAVALVAVVLMHSSPHGLTDLQTGVTPTSVAQLRGRHPTADARVRAATAVKKRPGAKRPSAVAPTTRATRPRTPVSASAGQGRTPATRPAAVGATVTPPSAATATSPPPATSPTASTPPTTSPPTTSPPTTSPPTTSPPTTSPPTTSPPTTSAPTTSPPTTSPPRTPSG
jgi:hypothetical protein